MGFEPKIPGVRRHPDRYTIANTFLYLACQPFNSSIPITYSGRWQPSFSVSKVVARRSLDLLSAP